MLRSKIYLILLLILISFMGCIKRYNPEFKPIDKYRLVVQGNITSEEGMQTISIYYTSPLNEPKDSGAIGFDVQMEDENGNIYQFYDTSGRGNYMRYMSQNDITIGKSYKLKILTANNERIESDFEMVYEPAAIDKIYFETKTIPTRDPLNPREGIQFFIDLDAQGVASKYFKWDLVETWEKHAPMPIIWWYDGYIHKEEPPDYSKMLCWQTEMVPNIFVLTTKNLSTPVYKKLPLHFVDTRSQRLSYKYSLLINQYSISASTFDYWEKMKSNLEQKDGLYTKQPISVIGNMRNITNSDEVVLGNFAVMGVSQKRIFVSDVPGIDANFEPCKSSGLRFGLRDISPYDYPAYLDGNDYTYFNSQLSPGCVDCTRNGGTNIKPSYWP